MNFYWFDAFILAFTLLLGLKGIFNGLIKEIFGLLGIVGGVFFASKYAFEAAQFIQNTFYKMQNQSLAEFAGFLAIFIIFWIVCLLLGNLLSKVVKFGSLGLDRIGGFLFSGAKIFFIFAVLVFCVSKIDFLNDKLNELGANSYTLNLLKETGSFIMNQPLVEMGSKHLSQDFEDLADDLNNTQKRGLIC